VNEIRPAHDPSRKASRAGTRRGEIIRSALELASEAGPENVSTGMIADRLGISQPALYKHFRNKRDIWAAIGEDIAARIAANLARAQEEIPTPVGRIRRQVLDHLRLIMEIPALPGMVLMRGHDASLAPLRERILAAMSSFHAALSADVASAVRCGRFAPGTDPDDAASLLLGLIQNLVLRTIISGMRGDPVNDGARMLDLLLRAFENPPRSTTGNHQEATQ